MKFKSYAILTGTLLLVASSAVAQLRVATDSAERDTVHSSTAKSGPSTGGGGHIVSTSFRRRAYQLIGRVARTPEADKLCSAAMMRRSLEASEIKVDTLIIDRNTKTPVNDNAWSWPGEVQLREDFWRETFDPTHKEPVLVTASGENVDALILHEIYRTTPYCDDHKGQISSEVIELLLQPSASVFSKSFKLVAPQAADHSQARNHCTGNYGSSPVFCLEVYAFEHRGAESSYIRLFEVKAESKRDLVSVLTTATFARKIQGILSFADTTTPFHVVFDLQNGKLSGGMDPGSLIPFVER